MRWHGFAPPNVAWTGIRVRLWLQSWHGDSSAVLRLPRSAFRMPHCSLFPERTYLCGAIDAERDDLRFVVGARHRERVLV